jgi:hypothetical protein
MRRFLLIAFAFGVFSSPAAAADRPWVPTSLTLSVRSAHFVAHFAPGSADPTRAQAMLDEGERALAMELAWGYPAPLPDDDGLLDV